VKSGDILDVGSGEGEFGKLIQKSQPMADQPMAEKFKVQSLEPHFSKILNTDVLKTDFLTWNTSKKFNAICFWESLEHVPDPLAYLKKAYALLKKGGHLFIEYPRNGVIESRLFEKYWFHLDIPRHLTHFTRQGMVHALKKAGFHVVSQKSVMSFEYSPGGLFLSCVRLFSNSRSSLNFDLKSLILASPLLPVCLICEIILYIFDQAPIGLLIVKKNEDHKMPNL
jgi:SAM-dependent methyltransferase